MTAPTPEQMRALAARNDAEAEAWRQFSKTSARIALHEESAAALRAAADQLEAVQAWAGISAGLGGTPNWAGLGNILTADTAPQAETCWACARENTTDVPEGNIPLCTKHWNWWVMRWLNAADEPPCAAHLITAPQEDRDECRTVFPGDFLGPPMFCNKPVGHDGSHDAKGMRWTDVKF
jgi:hypothetical protein